MAGNYVPPVVVDASCKDVSLSLRPNKICVFRVMGLKILCRVGTRIFFIIFFWKKSIIICILKIFSEHLKTILGFTSKFK